MFLLLFSFFSSWFFSTTHVYPNISILSLYFSLLSTWFQNLSLSLSFSSSLSQLFFFFFYLIPTHYSALSIIRNRERGRERKNRWVRWLHSATPSAPLFVPPQLPLCRHHLSSSPTQPRWLMACVFFSFSFFFFSFFLFFYFLWFDKF